MPVITYTRDGVSDIKALLCSLVIDLTGQGTPIDGSTPPADGYMKLVFPTDFDPTDPAAVNDSQIVILESTVNIDPFARADVLVEDPSKDPWRIAFHIHKWKGRSVYENNNITPDPIDEISLAVYVGTPSTLYTPADGTDPTIGWITTTKQKKPAYTTGTGLTTNLTYRTSYKGRDLVEPVGNVGAEWSNTFDPTLNNVKYPQIQPQSPSPYISPATWDGPDVTDAGQLFINRYASAGIKAASFGGYAADSLYSQPISYRLVFSDHGVFLGCWGPDPEENGRGFSWLLVQRPVDKKTGVVRGLPENPSNPGNRPLFCVNSVNGNFWKFVVREHDNPVPSTRKDATKNSKDSGAVINPYQQQSLTENGEYVITFLNNLNSSRFKYADELDMLGTVSSDVVGGGSEIEVNVYSEQDKRKYHALWSSGSYGTKMRIMVVKEIPSPNIPT